MTRRFRTTRSAIAWMRSAQNSPSIDHVAFYDKPFLKFERLLETYIAFAPRGFRSFQMAIPLWLKEKLFQKSLLRKELKKFDEEISVEQAAVHRASSEPCGIGVLSVAVREGGGADHGRRRRMGDDVGRARRGQQARNLPGDSLSPFARAALFGVHLLHRLQGQFRRVQGDGARALWRAEIRAS